MTESERSDRQAFETLVRRHQAQVCAVAYAGSHSDGHVVVGRILTGYLTIDTVEMEGTWRRAFEAPRLR